VFWIYEGIYFIILA